MRREINRSVRIGGGEWVRRTLQVGCCLLALLVSPLSSAQEPPPGGDLDGLLEGLDLQTEPEEMPPRDQRQNGSERAADPRGAADRGQPALAEAYRAMQTAHDLLAQGEVGEGALAAQRRVVDLLDELIRAAEQQQDDPGEASSQQPSATESSANAPEPSEAQSESGAQDNGQPQPGDGEEGAAEADSAEALAGEAGEGGEAAAPTAAAAGAGGADRRPGQGVWGHLPERTRGMLRSEMPTEYLPQYSAQISEYFRTLSEMKPDE